MKKYISSIQLLVFLLLTNTIHAQFINQSFDLDQLEECDPDGPQVPKEGQPFPEDSYECADVDYLARDYITLLPGYKSDGIDRDFSYAVNGDMLFDIKAEEFVLPENHTNRNIDTDKTFGSLPGSVSVDGSGSANYAIPIATPGGTAGLSPQISLYYNSNMGTGLLGSGFSISGLSAVSRISKNNYHDGEPSAIQLDNTDLFSVNGSRLMLETGSNGTEGATYTTEFKSFNTITSHGTAGNGPAWFEVTTQDNRTLTYGNLEESRQTSSTNATALAWFLTKVTDALGNYIEYNYEKTDLGEVYIQSIKYTGNTQTGLDPYNEIHFYYQNNSYSNFYYVGGERYESTVLLREVKSFTNNALLRKYELKYSDDAVFNKTFLSEVIEYNASGESLNATTFERFDVPAAYSSNFSNFDAVDPIFWGDFTGDGFTDYIRVNEASDKNDLDRENYYVLHRNDKSGNFTQLEGPHTISTTGFVNAIPGDFNGDNIQDIAFIIRTANCSNEIAVYQIQVYTGSATGLTSKSTHTITASCPNSEVNPKTLDWKMNIHAGDVDGDGIEDLVVNDAQYGLLKGTTGSNSMLPVEITFAALPQDGFLMDYDGDGKSEFITISENIQVFEYTNNTLVQVVDQSNVAGGKAVNWADFNGDGKTDVISASLSNNTWSISYGTGTGFFEQSININADPDYDRILVDDINADGLVDIVIIEDDMVITSPPEAGKVVTYRVSIGDGNNSFSTTEYTDGSGVSQSGKSYLHDINNNGQADLIIADYSPAYNRIHSFYRDNNSELVKSVMNGLGIVSEISYDDIGNSPTDGFYSITETPNHPLYTLNNGIYVVTNVKTYSTKSKGIDKELIGDVSYKYADAQVHKAGLGYMGFLKNTVTNNITNSESYSESVITSDRYLKLNTYARASKNGLLISEQTQTNHITTYNLSAGTGYFVYSPSSTVTDALNNTSITTTLDYNTITCNLNSKRVDLNDGSYTLTSFSNYKGNGSFLPEQVSIETKHSDDSQVFSTTNTVSFHNTYFYVLESYTNKNKQTEVKTEYLDYDNYGNPHTIRTTPVNLSSIEKTLEYDNTGRYVLSETNALGTASAVYNNYGQVESTTDMYGNTSYIYYDSWNRANKTVSATGVETQINRTWAAEIATTPSGTLVEQLGQTENAPYAKSYIDARGNTLRSETVGFGNRTYLQDNVFDTQNRLIQNSLVYLQGNSQLWNSYEYYTTDGRLKQTNGANGAVASLSYGALWSEQVINGKTYRTELQATGQVSRSINPMGSEVSYTYYSNGGVKEVTTPGGLVTYTYDSDGRLQSVSDPLLGTMDYQYNFNATGALNTTTDARGNSFETQYDNLNRPISVSNTANSEQTTITYVESGDGKGQVATTSYTDGTLTSSLSFTYDKYGRVITRTSVIGTESYSEEIDYNKYNQVTEIRNSLNKTKAFEYNELGLLVKKKYNSETIWELTESNLTDKTEVLGNGLTLQTELNQFGFLLSQKAGTILDLAYIFDDITGNLSSRTQRRYNTDGSFDNVLSEEFTYDDLDRLRTISSSGEDITVAYDETVNERIISKTDAGSNYTYSADNPFELEVVNNASQTLINESGDVITYNSFNKVSTISRGNQLLTISYGVGGQRAKAEYKLDGTTQYTKYYFGNYEKIVYNSTSSTVINQFVGAGNATLLEQDVDGTNTRYYLLKDHLGSVVVITDNNANLVEEFSYDAWGRRRNPADWKNTGVTMPTITNRGYTGHEHIDEFNLINMNGRVYDPLLALFLSPDPVTQSPLDPLNYNRYSYVSNNPLKFTDPSGYKKAPKSVTLKNNTFMSNLWAWADRGSGGRASGSSGGGLGSGTSVFDGFVDARAHGYTGSVGEYFDNHYGREAMGNEEWNTIKRHEREREAKRQKFKAAKKAGLSVYDSERDKDISDELLAFLFEQAKNYLNPKPPIMGPLTASIGGGFSLGIATNGGDDWNKGYRKMTGDEFVQSTKAQIKSLNDAGTNTTLVGAGISAALMKAHWTIGTVGLLMTSAYAIDISHMDGEMSDILLNYIDQCKVGDNLYQLNKSVYVKQVKSGWTYPGVYMRTDYTYYTEDGFELGTLHGW